MFGGRKINQSRGKKLKTLCPRPVVRLVCMLYKTAEKQQIIKQAQKESPFYDLEYRAGYAVKQSESDSMGHAPDQTRYKHGHKKCDEEDGHIDHNLDRSRSRISLSETYMRDNLRRKHTRGDNADDETGNLAYLGNESAHKTGDRSHGETHTDYNQHYIICHNNLNYKPLSHTFGPRGFEWQNY